MMLLGLEEGTLRGEGKLVDEGRTLGVGKRLGDTKDFFIGRVR
jgi:hypothetical protein